MDTIERARVAREELDHIKYLMKTGQISFDTARERAVEPLKALNAGMATLSRQYGMKHRVVGFSAYMR